jgi:hypothetical protein
MGRKAISLENFIENANNVHSFTYDYLNVNYINSCTKIEIICSKHGSFFQQPRAHLAGQGCPVCGSLRTGASVKLTLEQFIEKANIIHNNFYDYSESKYTGALNKVLIICPKHNEFMQAAHNHLSGLGCEKCSRGAVSKSETKWLDTLNVPLEYRQTSIKVGGVKYFVDALNPLTNTIYEFYGDYWHGNPKIFNINDFNKKKDKSFGELYIQTINRENILKNAGYNIISIWENDWKKL